MSHGFSILDPRSSILGFRHQGSEYVLTFVKLFIAS
jgi:hypothetical protein